MHDILPQVVGRRGGFLSLASCKVYFRTTQVLVCMVTSDEPPYDGILAGA